MADDAIRVYADGSEEVVYAKEIEEEVPGSHYLCNGIDDDENPCRIPVVLVGRKSGKYFSAKGEQHIAGCNCDKKRDTRMISSMDRIGKKITPDDVYAIIGKGVGARGGGGGRPGGGGGPGGGYGTGIQRPDCRPVMHVFTNPESLRLLVKLLLGKAGKGNYAGTPTSDWLLDASGVARARKNGIPKGSLKIAFAEKTTRWKEFSLPLIEDGSNYERIVLVDAFFYENGRKPTFYILEISHEMAEEILGKEPAKYVIAILSHWYQYGEETDAYISDRERDKHIAILRRSDVSALFGK